MDDEMLPPWLQYPEIPLGSMGWRMNNFSTAAWLQNCRKALRYVLLGRAVK